MLRRLLLLATLLFTVPSWAVPLGDLDARFLLTRTGFSPTEAEVQKFARLERAQAVALIVDTASALAQKPLPPWRHEPLIKPAVLRDASPDERRAYQRLDGQRNFDSKAWWVDQMIATPTPLAERMVLFWHNHFTSSGQKVRAAQLMLRQHLSLRTHALGNFGQMLHELARDPAMLIYLDGASNRKQSPNENFAREVMELFALGEGKYSERDVKEAARAFTGWSIDRENDAAFLFRSGQHDEGSKTVLGVSGNLTGEQVLEILLAQPACADFIVSKLWREFISPNPDAAEVRRIAAQFRGARYDIKTALRALFTSPHFFAAENRATLVKSPIDLVVGTARQLQLTYSDALPFALVAAGLGQNLFAPPNVKGWPGGEAWINSTTLLNRKQFLERLFRVDEMREVARMMPPPDLRATPDAPMPLAMRPNEVGPIQGIARLGPEGRERFRAAVANIHFDSAKWLDQYAGKPYSDVKRALLPVDPAHPIKADTDQFALLKALVLDPTYQLK